MPWIQSNQCAKWLILRWHILVTLLHRENNSLLIYKCVPFVLHPCCVGLTARLVGLWSVIYRHKTQEWRIYRPSTASLSSDPSHSNHPDPGVHPSPSTPTFHLDTLYGLFDNPRWQLINTTVPVKTCFPTFVPLCSSVTITVSRLYYPHWEER